MTSRHHIKKEKDATIKLAESLGFTHEPQPNSWVHFHNNARRVWRCRDFWQTADIMDGQFENHKHFNTVEEALKRTIVHF